MNREQPDTASERERVAELHREAAADYAAAQAQRDQCDHRDDVHLIAESVAATIADDTGQDRNAHRESADVPGEAP
ncbi:hypothetical protein [Streptomyces sp. PR69]|uniref:hypothetical protein n=1 Tax=Streptomyces sp. PR69 TaxID=2984950 RepID=UPI002263E97B|nr:hypothetical protein [Streptomyces sp. PR69]